MLESGSSAPFFELMFDAGFLDILLPAIAKYLRGPHGDNLYAHLRAADALVTQSRGPTPDRSALAACIFYPLLVERISSHEKGDALTFGDIMDITHDVVGSVSASAFPHFPRRLLHMVSFIANTQYRFTPISEGSFRYARLLRHEEFRHALAFLKIRTLVDGDITRSYSLWRQRWESAKASSGFETRSTIPASRPRRRRRGPR